jgi:hypothetical protein
MSVNLPILIAGIQLGVDVISKDGNYLMQYYQLKIEIAEANSLKPFVEEARDGVGTALVTGNNALFKQALQKQEEIEWLVEKLELSLNIGVCERKKAKAFGDGMRLLAAKKRKHVREDIEMLSFSISQRVKNISRLAGRYVVVVSKWISCNEMRS